VKSQPTNTIDDTLLAVAERQAEGWRVLLVRRGDRPTILNAREFSANDQTGLAAWLDSQRCGDLRVILPAAATIVRTQSMPAAAPLQAAPPSTTRSAPSPTRRRRSWRGAARACGSWSTWEATSASGRPRCWG
jgi:hypothetical protein